MGVKTSTQLEIGKTYSRAELAQMFDIKDATLNTGIFRPGGHDSVWLFITENKTADRTQYKDHLQGEDLFFEGQTQGRTDNLIRQHRPQDLELLLFFRDKKDERPDYSFEYKGVFEFIDAQSGPPTQFHLRRVRTSRVPTVQFELVTTLSAIKENIRRYNRDLRMNLARAVELARRTTYWVFDSETGEFGPSKFVGFSRMTFSRYERGTAGDSTGTKFDGHLTRTAIEKLASTFQPNAALRTMLRQRLDEIFEDAAEGADSNKWQFAVVPATRRYWMLVCNPNNFNIVGAASALNEMAWTVDRGEFSPGDRVAVWQAKGRTDQRGVVALGEVTRGVETELPPEDERPFWMDLDAAARPRIRFQLIRSPNLPVWESEHTWLGELAAARARGGTVFAITPEDWYRIAGEVESEMPDITLEYSAKPKTGQGYGLNSAQKRAIEMHAQAIAEEYFIGLDFEVADVHKSCCYDLHCTRGTSEVRVEVKGTTGDGTAILLTANEVEHARNYKTSVALVLVTGIELDRSSGTVSGGSMRVVQPWDIDLGTLVPIQFRYQPPVGL